MTESLSRAEILLGLTRSTFRKSLSCDCVCFVISLFNKGELQLFTYSSTDIKTICLFNFSLDKWKQCFLLWLLFNYPFKWIGWNLISCVLFLYCTKREKRWRPSNLVKTIDRSKSQVPCQTDNGNSQGAVIMAFKKGTQCRQLSLTLY